MPTDANIVLIIHSFWKLI